MPEYAVELIERATGQWRTESVFAESVDEARAIVHREGWLIGEVQQLPGSQIEPPPSPPPIRRPPQHEQTRDSLTRADIRAGVWQGKMMYDLIILSVLILVVLLCAGLVI